MDKGVFSSMTAAKLTETDVVKLFLAEKGMLLIFLNAAAIKNTRSL